MTKINANSTNVTKNILLIFGYFFIHKDKIKIKVNIA